jgi:hypothetical protein
MGVVSDYYNDNLIEGTPHFWSQMNNWQIQSTRAGEQYAAISNTYPPEKTTFFNIFLRGFVIANGNYDVDLIKTHNANAVLQVPEGVTLQAFKVYMSNNAFLHVDGQLVAERIYLDESSELKGNGTIIMPQTARHRRASLEGELTGSLHTEGHINLADDISQLTVEGGVFNEGVMSFLLQNDASSVLHARRDVFLREEGRLRLLVDQLTHQDEMQVSDMWAPNPPFVSLDIFGSEPLGMPMPLFGARMPFFEQRLRPTERRWTIISTNSQVFGTFSSVELVGNLPLGAEISVEYFPTQVEVVLRQS